MGAVAFLFAGQGAQAPGMCADLIEAEPAAAAVFEMADSVRPGTTEQCLHGTADELRLTRNTQPCVFAADLACARALAAHGVSPVACAGFSLGEIAALAFTGAMSDVEAMAFVCLRAQLMDDVSARHPGGMRAVLKLDEGKVEELAAKAGDCWPVNYNSPAQTVVAGLPDGLDRLDVLVREAKGRSLPVKVSGAFHSPLMTEVSASLSAYLDNHPITQPEMPVWANATAAPYEGTPARLAYVLSAQASHPVRWTRTLTGMRASGIDTFVEVGPGHTLTGLVRHTLDGVVALPCGTMDQLGEVLSELDTDEGTDL
ncbi:MAG: ACP S-malonyltransferase [Atopobiaceae bacterium]|nr:ACP S-malonyltransferase [Atopobiaceae bacterium]MCH4179981.1 ACP S-malonyltransferase [Atopobiaceae bacterium]MCH4213732.1 ACP S-malonyltransferase [Atopobiaceae bacterium]MCH4230077.1 ACP S-malonyltransferase [Atopobiaceae bacterium]MCH4275911.1 ACP S-malonyltransferase [Atopobiaceae bacterium]